MTVKRPSGASGPTSPDLVLLDVMMPKKNGFDVCQEVRADPAYASTRILMLTARGRDTEVARGWRSAPTAT